MVPVIVTEDNMMLFSNEIKAYMVKPKPHAYGMKGCDLSSARGNLVGQSGNSRHDIVSEGTTRRDCLLNT